MLSFADAVEAHAKQPSNAVRPYFYMSFTFKKKEIGEPYSLLY